MESNEQLNHEAVIDSLKSNLTVEKARLFLKRLYNKYQYSNDTPNLIIASQNIEPFDKALGVDPELVTSFAFFNGTNIGKHIVDLLHPYVLFKKKVSLEVEEMITRASASVSDIEDGYERGQEFGQAILDLAWEGCSKYPDIVAVIEEREDDLIDDANKSQFLRLGAGFVLLAMYRVEVSEAMIATEKDLHAMKTEINLIDRGENNMDWDGFLIELSKESN